MSSDPYSSFKRTMASNRFTRVLLKWIDRENYERLKNEVKRERLQKGFKTYKWPGANVRTKPEATSVVCKHSGNVGDIIYALPAVKALGGRGGARLRLALDTPVRDRSVNHSMGGVYLNRRTFDMLMPLLRGQDYLKEVSMYDGGAIDCDLDVFRDSPLPVDRFGICRWYFHLFGVSADLCQPWLSVEPDPAYAKTVVVARSFRYRNLSFQYGFLNTVEDVAFVGLRDEFDDFKSHVPCARWVQTGDFLEMARVIAGSRFFIGNQSFPFSLAEALKVPRVLEVDPGMPNVVPSGGEAYDVVFQEQFERVVGKLLQSR